MKDIDKYSEKTFVSYSHDSYVHRQRVLELSDRLRDEGIDCECDRYESWPKEGWTKWMEKHVMFSKYVLIVWTKVYAERYMHEAIQEGKGLGVKQEAAIITQLLYEAGQVNHKFISITLNESDETYIPPLFKSYTRFCVSNEKGYERLYRFLTDQPEIARKPLGKRRVLMPENDIAKDVDVLTSQPESVDDHFDQLPIIPGFTDTMQTPNFELALAFLSKPPSARRLIAQKLNLLAASEDPKELRSAKLSGEVLLRAQERGLLKELWELLFDINSNPFPSNPNQN